MPIKYKEDVSLGCWVKAQRHWHTKKTIRQDRKKLLDDVGFVWNVDNHEWHLQYEKLVVFKRKNDHCVPSYEQDASLSTWVSTQRTRHTNNKMQPHRKELLNQVGFIWDAHDARGSVVRIGSDPPDQELVQEEAMADEIPSGWTHVKLEPDW